ncbi:hypothetical protein KAI87_15520 [Myxococcota bacterium]|nr:hypothetical protein [Myxococcota bacterium]
MKSAFYATVSASIAMLITSGIIAFATAAPSPITTQNEIDAELRRAEADLEEQVDSMIASQIAQIRAGLHTK